MVRESLESVPAIILYNVAQIA